MSYFLLVITFMLSNGQKSVSITKFDTNAECFQAMQLVMREAPQATTYCQQIDRVGPNE